jgi:uncharacterized glyoxalase superfamily protein PhnB
MTAIEPGIVGRDEQALVAFYTEVLQFEVVDRLVFPGLGHLVKLRRGGARFKIFLPEHTPSAALAADPYWEVAGWRYAALLLDDVDELRQVFERVARSSGRVVMEPRTHRPDAQAGLIADPEGNHWELLWELR